MASPGNIAQEEDVAPASAESDEGLSTLMSSYQEGSLDAFQSLYARLAPSLRRYLQSLAGAEFASDLLQETFLQMHRSRGAYNSAYSVRPWVFGLARNVFLMHRRRRRRFTSVHDVQRVLPDVSAPAAVEKLGTEDEIRRAIADLKPERAESLLLHHEWGFSFDEIAGMLGIGTEAARARATRGIADLRKALQKGKRGRP